MEDEHTKKIYELKIQFMDLKVGCDNRVKEFKHLIDDFRKIMRLLMPLKKLIQKKWQNMSKKVTENLMSC